MRHPQLEIKRRGSKIESLNGRDNRFVNLSEEWKYVDGREDTNSQYINIVSYTIIADAKQSLKNHILWRSWPRLKTLVLPFSLGQRSSWMEPRNSRLGHLKTFPCNKQFQNAAHVITSLVWSGLSPCVRSRPHVQHNFVLCCAWWRTCVCVCVWGGGGWPRMMYQHRSSPMRMSLAARYSNAVRRSTLMANDSNEKIGFRFL